LVNPEWLFRGALPASAASWTLLKDFTSKFEMLLTVPLLRPAVDGLDVLSSAEDKASESEQLRAKLSSALAKEAWEHVFGRLRDFSSVLGPFGCEGKAMPAAASDDLTRLTTDSADTSNHIRIHC
jgi:hypothetical protein